MYRALILLAEDLELERFRDKLIERFASYPDSSRPVLSSSHVGLVLKFGDYVFEISKTQGDHVRTESAEIAAQFAPASEREAIARVAVRLEVVSTAPDDDMLHFNDLVAILEVAEGLGKAWLFDAVAGEFM
ncbi:MAG: hypothetical protein AAF219_10670 [Myxococcota bacterium]